MTASTVPGEETPLLEDHTNNSILENDAEDQEPMPNAEATSVIDDEPSTLHIFILMSGVFLSVFTAAVDSSMIATLTAPVSATFGSLSRLSWLTSAYFIANAAIRPLSGKISDIYGRRDSLIASNVIFAIGDLICAFAETEWVLIFGRLVAGIGGGGLMAVGTFVISDVAPLRRRGLWQGMGNVFFGTVNETR